MGEVSRSRIAAVICLVGLILYAAVAHAHYPIQEWLFFKLALIGCYVATFTASCVAVGHMLLRRSFGIRDLLLSETWLLSMGLGLVAFVLAIYLAGALGAFHPLFAMGLPIAFIAAGRRDLSALCRRSFVELTAPEDGSRIGRVIRHGATIWAAFGLGLLYLVGLTPDTISLDAAWYHLPVAHDYVRAGGFIPFPSEYNRAHPQMNSLLFTWGFLLPGMRHPLDWMLALQLDYSMIIWKAVGVAAGAEYMLGDRRVRGLWTGFFLFPLVFTFANAVSGGPEHVSGFWAIPMFLATSRMLKEFSTRWAVLLGVMAGGAILSRYQSVYMIAACGTLILFRWLWLLVPHRRGSVRGRDLWRVPLLVMGVAIAVSAPHFIKNAVFYGDPMYPFLAGVLSTAHPTHPEAMAFFHSTLGDPDNRPPFRGLGRIAAAFRLFFTFSFHPHHVVVKQAWPVFGSLFTLLMPCVLFISRSRRIWLGIACCFVVIAVWCNLYLQTRYLNTASTIFAATAMALLVRVWELGRTAKIGCAALVAFQLIWQADAITYTGEKPLVAALKLARSGWAGELDDETRFPYRRGFQGVTEATPEDAQILVRGPRAILGLDRYAHRDVQSQQGNFYFAPLHDSAQLWQHYRDRGITHIVFNRDSDYAGTLQSAVLFGDLIARQGMPLQKFGEWELVELSAAPPLAPSPTLVVVLGVTCGYRDGLYHPEDLSIRAALDADRPPTAEPRTLIGNEHEATRAIRKAHVVVVGPNATLAKLKKPLASYELAEKIDGVRIYVRRAI